MGVDFFKGERSCIRHTTSEHLTKDALISAFQAILGLFRIALQARKDLRTALTFVGCDGRKAEAVNEDRRSK